jgi:RNA polymerase sigma factor (sigma-70 family)
MAVAQLDAVRRVFDRVRVRDQADGGDGDLLLRYRRERDQGAFGSLVRRHGPMVLGVCRRVLRNEHAAEDAFQATFVVLAKRADAVKPPDKLAPWLYGVAYRTALKARGRAFRRAEVERDYATEVAHRTPGEPEALPDVLPIIDEQLNALPEKYRAPLVLCGLQGLNKQEAAERLGVPEGTVSSRLARAREMLRDRLARRGVVVPAAGFVALLAPNALCAAVPPALTESVSACAAVGAAVPATVRTLSNEVLAAMSWLEVKTLCAGLVAFALAGGGMFALTADDKKPAQPPAGDKPVKPAEKPGEKPTGKPDGEKPAKPDGEKPARVLKLSGKVGGIDVKENTITLAVRGDSGVVERYYPLAANAKITVDGKEAKLADVPKNATATGLASATKEGQLPQITELRVTGEIVTGVVKAADASSVTLAGGEGADKVFKTNAETQVTLNGKPAKTTDLKVGDKATVILTSNGATALSVLAGAKRGEPEKPGEKPVRPEARAFAGKIASVDAATRTLLLASKGEGGRELPVKLTADAKITIDGKAAKLDDLKKGMLASFTIAAAKDGQPREATAVTVTGPTFNGVVKQIDASTITVGNEKVDRVFKLAPGGKVMFGEKEGKFADVKAGDRVTVTLASDDSGAVLIVVGAKREGGDKPKGDKEEGDE